MNDRADTNPPASDSTNGVEPTPEGRPLTFRGPGRLNNTQQVDDALAKLHREATRELGGEPAARARVLNLIICADHNSTGARRAAQAIERLAATHPSRTIRLLLSDADDPTGGVSAWPTLICLRHGASRQFFEDVEVVATGAAAEHTGATIAPLLVADLPVFLWWVGDPPTASDSFRQLASLADRVIVDSSALEFLGPGLRRLAQAGQVSRAAWSDLAWTRLTPWRELITRLFDSATMRPALEKIDRIEIDHLGSAALCLLMLGWLASRLGWSITGNLLPAPSGQTVASLAAESFGNLNAPSHPVAIHLRRMGPGSGRILDLRMTADGLRMRLSRSQDGGYATVHLDRADGHTVEQTIALPPTSDAALIASELRLFGRDSTYEEALRGAGQLAGAL